jgi:hypothetical protein|tara:strand:+ start:1185 stop:1805 length:621 start_codon:yes stop_codon:yes gene_type:complete
MPSKKIAWENWKEKVDYSPPENKLEEAVEEDEDAIEKSLLSAMEIPRLVQTPLGIFHYEDKLKPSEKFDCWIGYTNFDITQNVSDLIECVDGVEALEVMSRYTFFLGVGKMFNFRDVRLGIESLILEPEYPEDTLTILDSDEIIRSVEIIKEQLSSEKHWAIFVSNEGDIDYAKTDNKNDEQFLKTVLFFEETKQSIGGFILKSGD